MKIVLLVISIILGACGQLFLKLAARGVIEYEHTLDYLLQLLKIPFTYLGTLAYGISLVLWMILLSIFDLSFIRPLVGLGYIVTAVLALIFLQEKITIIRWLGILLIVAGVSLVGMTVKS